MLNSEGVTKLTDFGIAKARMLMEQEEGEVLMGKVEYMSPEQSQYQETDPRSDVFSLGIVMYELLTGYHIFETADIYETLKNVKEKPIPDPRTFRADLSEDLVRILNRALERPMERRYQTAGEMGYDLEYYMYHDRYGPTNVTLSNYLKKHFLGLPAEGRDLSRKASARVLSRADSAYADPGSKDRGMS
jgi:serine/threonine-protein kinase